ncbi:MAG: PilZ domain-containing protein [Polyangiaceae bacterium]
MSGKRFDATIAEQDVLTTRDKRVHSRFKLWFPVTLVYGKKQVWAMCRDASAGGMSIASSAHVNVGSSVTLRFRVSPSEEKDRVATGKVLRVVLDADDPDGTWPHHIAIAFDAPIEELAGVFQARATEPPPGPDSSLPPR